MYLDNLVLNEHQYSFATVGLPKKYNKMFCSRQAANEFMYKLCRKFDLTIKEIYDDKHDKTYKCDKGVKFFIQRV